jgi:hypothetical protein
MPSNFFFISKELNIEDKIKLQNVFKDYPQNTPFSFITELSNHHSILIDENPLASQMSEDEFYDEDLTNSSEESESERTDDRSHFPPPLKIDTEDSESANEIS